MRDAKFVTIGFDVREVVPTSAIRRLDQLNQMVAWPSKVLTTADAMVQPKPPRYRYQENSSDAETSILGFFRPIGGLIRSVRADISGTEKIYVYRLRSEIVAYIEERFGCIEREFDLATDASEFQQIGFDVVDIDGLTSGLWGCSFEIWEKELWAPHFQKHLNRFGLFDDENFAARFAQCRSLVVEEHAPFLSLQILAMPD
ncbi:MAG: hypothetical protein H6875_10855 [Hyphomicrobiaceae bacterium]|nr:hypothetical protein [Hyphomicrobiaceae bacterium]